MTKKVLTLLLAVVMLTAVCPMISAEAEMKTELSNVADDGAAATSTGGVRFGGPGNLNDGNLKTRTVFPYGTGTELTAPTQIPTVTIDMKRSWQIEKIVIHDNESEEDVDASDVVLMKTITSNTRAQFEIYGSNDSAFTEKELLFEINIPADDTTLSTVFPVGGEYTIDLSDKKPVYRYIRYKNKTQGYVNMREIEVYANQTTSVSGDVTTIHPNLYGAEYSAENNTVTLSFSEDMSGETITKESVKLYKSGGAEVSYDSITASGNTATISLGENILQGGYYYVEADSSITNTADAALKSAKLSFAVEISTVSGLKTAATKLVNVARNKSVTVSDGSNSAALTDGDYRNSSQWVASGNAATETAYSTAPWAQIDLGKRYPIEKIVVFDSGNSVGKTVRQQFKIYGSNDPDFNSKEEIYYTNETENITFPEHSGFVIDLPGEPVYRYIRYQGLGYGEVIVRELLVYASVTVSEIDLTGKTVNTTRNNNGTTGVEDVANAKTIIDGKALNGFNVWNGGQHVEGAGTVYQTITIDMGAEYPVGVVEVYAGETYSGSTKAGSQYAIYGSNTPIDNLYSGTVNVTESGSDATKYYGELTPTQWVALGQTILDPGQDVPSNYSTLYGGMEAVTDSVKWPRFKLSDGSYFDPVPFNVGVTDEEACNAYQTTMSNDENAYRFLTWRKTQKELASIDEIKAYVIHPEAYGVSATSNTARIAMSDYNINANTVVKETVKLYDSSNNEVNYASVKLDGADIVITFADNMTVGENYKVVVDGIINNQGVAMAENREFIFILSDTDYRITNVEAQTSVEADRACTVAFDIENEGEAVNVMATVAVYNENKLMAIKAVEASVANGEIKPVRAEVRAAIPEGAAPTAKVFIWNADTLAPIYTVD